MSVIMGGRDAQIAETRTSMYRDGHWTKFQLETFHIRFFSKFESRVFKASLKDVLAYEFIFLQNAPHDKRYRNFVDIKANT